jgi:hypothetical protein
MTNRNRPPGTPALVMVRHRQGNPYTYQPRARERVGPVQVTPDPHVTRAANPTDLTLGWGSGRDNPAALHEEQLIAQALRLGRIVGNQEDGGLPLPLHL